MKKHSKQVCALLLAGCMSMGIFPSAVIAQDVSVPGIPENPDVIQAEPVSKQAISAEESVDRAATTDDPLGADGACEGYIYGTFNGFPACVNEYGDLHICEQNFPDGVFREYVKENFDKDSDGWLTLEEITAVWLINLSYEHDLLSVSGIEFFAVLTDLDCSVNDQLIELNVSGNLALTDLDCSSNKLAELDVSQNPALTSLNCTFNQLTELDVSQNPALTSLDCSSNQLAELDVSRNTVLIDLNCNSNQLTELDVSRNTALTDLDCSSNQLAELDVSRNTVLIDLNCNSNQLAELDVSGNLALTDLDCSYNQLAELDVSGNPNLAYLHFYGNPLMSLDLSYNKKLSHFGSAEFDSRLTLPAVFQNREYVFDFSDYLSADELSHVHLDMDNSNIKSYDPQTGLLTLWRPGQIKYIYDTEAVNGLVMINVYISLTVTCERHIPSTWEVQTPAGCTKPGLEIQYCTQCGEIINTREIPATGHQWSQRTVVKPATCTQLGKEQWVCSVCGMKETREISALGHVDGEWIVVREASCTQTGLQELHCTRCGEVLQSEEIPMTEHIAGTWEVQTPATCTEPGLEVQYCTQCGQIINTRELPATGHQWGEWIIEKPATADSDGLQYRVCQSCGEREEQVIPALPATPGDADGNGAIDGKDLLLMEQAVNGWDVSLIAQNADLNGDGKVNGFDLLLMYQKINSEGA